jgi:membrane protease YdiL (CAAX protease family)
MPTWIDLLYVALFAVASPLYGYFVFWPSFEQRKRESPLKARWHLWSRSVPEYWAIVAIGAAIWLWFGRPWADLKFTVPAGWQLAVAVVLIAAYAAYQLYAIAALRRDAELRASLRASFGELGGILPRTRSEVSMFTVVSVTAGFCEEFLFRAFFPWALAPWLGWWGAAAVSVVIFGLGHAYQGVRGMIQTGIFGAFYTAIVWLTDSLWPAIVSHVLVDAFAGVMAWIALRDEASLER